MPTRPTIIDVARHAGVSKSTVSRVLQGGEVPVSAEAETRVWEAVRALGYERNQLARSLRTDRTNMIMLVTPDITNPFWPEVARGVQDTVEKQGYSVVLANSDWAPEREQKFLQTLRANRFDALIINPTAVSNLEAAVAGIPTVILGLYNPFQKLDMVGSDSLAGTLQALEHLYFLGHRRIAFIWGQHRLGWGQSRLEGYRQFLALHALPDDPDLVVETPFEVAGGYAAAAQLLRLPTPPTAIFASNDVLAIGAMQAVNAAGLKIPHQLSIIGMDDIYAAALTTPALTTIAKAKYETGRWAAHFCLERIAGRGPERGRRHSIQCQLVVRGSTAPPGG